MCDMLQLVAAIGSSTAGFSDKLKHVAHWLLRELAAHRAVRKFSVVHVDVVLSGLLND